MTCEDRSSNESRGLGKPRDDYCTSTPWRSIITLLTLASNSNMLLMLGRRLSMGGWEQEGRESSSDASPRGLTLAR